MELVNALLIAVNMLIGGQQAPVTGSAATISQGSSVIVVHDTLEQN
jgi:hypothetical protein